MTDQTPKTGEITPDLARVGIGESELTAGRMVVGHVAGDKALLARMDNKILAIGATCTHYGVRWARVCWCCVLACALV